MNMEKVLWSPSAKRIESSLMHSYLKKKGKKDYAELHRYSVENPVEFWRDLFSEFPLIYEGETLMDEKDLGFESYNWFPHVKLNFAENLLFFGKEKKTALHSIHESKRIRKISYGELRDQTARFACFLEDYLDEGDVLACYMPNIPETVISMLATSSLGGIFTSTSTDFGVTGVLERFTQVNPKILVTVNAYQYAGKIFDIMPRLSELEKKIPSLKKIIVVNFLKEKKNVVLKKEVSWEEATERKKKIDFKRLSFKSPLYIMYSSGTTGTPKCIVHTVGGVLLQHVKELGYHCDLNHKKSIFYFTTCGWMMWNWLVSSLFFGARVVLYEGSPLYPKIEDFLQMIKREDIHFFGTSPRFLKAWEDSFKKRGKIVFPSLETIMSTGAPLMPEQFDFVYEKVKKDVQLASISGGTDIIGCFMLGNPLLPVVRGEIQCLGLGMDIACFNENGSEIVGEEGELICKKSFPSRPLKFWGDEKKELINKAYFNRFPGVWHHGDFIKITNRQTVVIYGRSDATLNPGGVRIGTAEIYRQVECLDYIEDSLCVGVNNEGDVEIVLFVKFKENKKLDDSCKEEIKKYIREKTTPRHVPKKIYQVLEIPYTRSGKKMEMTVSRLLNDRPLNNKEAMANPNALLEYEKFC